MISKDEVKKIAGLARIEITENQIGEYQEDLSQILDFVSKLSEVDTKETEPLKQISGLENSFRKDESEKFGHVSSEELIKLAAEHNQNYVVVPEVLKERDKK